MPTYVVHHKIDTILELWEPFDFNGFSFSAWSIDCEAGRQDGWLAKKQIDADTVEQAFEQFSSEFHRIVDRIGFIGQCHTAAELESFIICKPNDERFFWQYTTKMEPVPLHFNENEIRSLTILNQYVESGDVFRCLREATNATSFYTMFVMLVSALEAIAGTTNEKGSRVINKNVIADEILKDKELTDKLFKFGEGIRNQILHGGFVDHDMHGGTNYNKIIYNSIIDYFNECHGSEIDKGPVGRPRTIIGSCGVWRGWCEWVKEDEALSLEVLNQKIDASDEAKYFKTIDKPDDF